MAQGRLRIYLALFLPDGCLTSPQDHNRRCLELLEPFLRDDKRALKYLRREAERGIGIAGAGPGGLTIDWD